MGSFRCVSKVDLGPFRPVVGIPTDLYKDRQLELVLGMRLSD